MYSNSYVIMVVDIEADVLAGQCLHGQFVLSIVFHYAARYDVVFQKIGQGVDVAGKGTKRCVGDLGESVVGRSENGKISFK